MSDLSLTASAVIPSAGASLERGTSGATITAGCVVYKDAAQLIQLSDANGAAELRAVAGIAVNGASAGQPVDFVPMDSALALGSVLTIGQPYFLSGTPGKICPYADLATGMAGIFLGVATSSSTLNFKPAIGGQIP